MLKLGKATIDWVHGLQVLLAALATVAGYFASHASSLPLGLTSGTCGLAALVIGLIYKSIFHEDLPPGNFNGNPSEQPTKPDVPSVPPARNVSTTGPIPMAGAISDAEAVRQGFIVHNRPVWAPKPPRPIAGMLIAAMLLMALFLLPRCSGNGPSPNVIAPSVDTAICILTNVTVDVIAKTPWPQVIVDVGQKCGANAATIARVWDAHEMALVRQGFIPPPIEGYTLPVVAK